MINFSFLAFVYYIYYSGVSGWYPERIAQEIIHNRTANIYGGAGHNIPLDLLNEFHNNEFKGSFNKNKILKNHLSSWCS